MGPSGGCLRYGHKIRLDWVAGPVRPGTGSKRVVKTYPVDHEHFMRDRARWFVWRPRCGSARRGLRLGNGWLVGLGVVTQAVFARQGPQKILAMTRGNSGWPIIFLSLAGMECQDVWDSCSC